MSTEVIIHAPDYTVERDSINIIVEKNLQGKIDSYIKKHNKGDELVRVELSLKREKDTQAAGKLVITIDGKSYRSERENFDNVHDLVNHLFTHLKDQLAK